MKLTICGKCVATKCDTSRMTCTKVKTKKITCDLCGKRRFGCEYEMEGEGGIAEAGKLPGGLA